MLHKDLWLSQYFDHDAYAYKPPFDEQSLPAGFITAKIPTDDLQSVHRLCDQGFYIVEVLTQFEQQSNLARKKTDFITRLSKPEDKDAVVEIARQAFTASRLYQDPNIANETAAQIKANWVANFYNGARGDLMIVAEQNGEIMGFNLLIGNVIDLIAVSQNHTQKGIASAMIAHANDKIGPLTAGTQIINAPSIALYQKAGFIIKNAHYVLHRHT